MFKIGMIDQIMRYLIVVVLWQLSQEDVQMHILCWSHWLLIGQQLNKNIIIKLNFTIWD